MPITADADNENDASAGRPFRLGALLIHPVDGTVTGPGGREQLDPKVMAVLALLAGRAGHVVTREELLSQVWANAVVTDDVLSRCIYELRRQLAIAGGDEQLKAVIETVPKRGYRLNAEITAPTAAAGDDAPPRSRTPLLVLGAALALVAVLWIALGRQPIDGAATYSVAVLPFLDMSEGQDQGYLADGITEEIINRLTQAGNLRVISRTSSFAFRGKPADVRDIARRLDVTHVLEGSIRRSGDTVRITTQLIAATDNAHVWSQNYDRRLGDLFAVQDEISESVAAALQARLAELPSSTRMPANPEAHEKYLQGRYFFHRRAPGDFQRAARYYEEALRADPEYAVAWAALAGAYYVMADLGEMPWEEARAHQLHAAQNAIRFDPGLAVGYTRLGQYHFEGGDLEAARKAYASARALDPSIPSPGAGGGMLRHFQDDPDGVLQLERQDVARDPLSANVRRNFGILLFAAGRLDEAEAELLKALDLSPEMGADTEIELARVLAAQGRHEEARSHALRLPAGPMRDHVLALLFDAPGQRAEADAALGRLAAREDRDTMQSVRLAEIYALRGRPDDAFAEVSRFIAGLDPADRRTLSRRWWMLEELGVSPFLKSLHADPRWTALMKNPA
jgi:TolB-like protein/DNA-binding winged helix-turn-helix (wHTH) protein/Tfp pilus assembly protein PilF